MFPFLYNFQVDLKSSLLLGSSKSSTGWGYVFFRAREDLFFFVTSISNISFFSAT